MEPRPTLRLVHRSTYHATTLVHGQRLSPYDVKICMATMDAESVFLDTNILIRATIDTAPLHTEARQAVEQWYGAGSELWISRQVLREYLAVLSRPQTYTSPLPATTLSNDIRRFMSVFRVADEDGRVTDQLLALLEEIPVGGRQIHDANIVATMLVYGIPQIMTHNIDDFTRFARFVRVLPRRAGSTDG